MADLSTNFVGLSLRNPIIVSSSGLTDKVEKIRKLRDAGAAAVVLKSLFEEQILFETMKIESSSDYPEAHDYVSYYTRQNSVDRYLDLIEGSKKEVDIPVIASINCMTDSDWTGFAGKIEEAGADALELNIYYLPVDKDKTGAEYERIYLSIAEKVCKLISIPVIVKLGPNFTNPVNIINQLYYRGVKAVVLFNRFYSPDINISEKKLTSSAVFSSEDELRISLRWVAIVSGMIENIQVAASTGVHDGEAVIKQLMAGATVVQVCSAIYNKGPDYLTEIIQQVTDWMDQNKFDNISRFRSSMNYRKLEDPAIYERSQFMRYFSSHY